MELEFVARRHQLILFGGNILADFGSSPPTTSYGCDFAECGGTCSKI
jgi:hypothetical protein